MNSVRVNRFVGTNDEIFEAIANKPFSERVHVHGYNHENVPAFEKISIKTSRFRGTVTCKKVFTDFFETSQEYNDIHIHPRPNFSNRIHSLITSHPQCPRSISSLRELGKHPVEENKPCGFIRLYSECPIADHGCPLRASTTFKLDQMSSYYSNPQKMVEYEVIIEPKYHLHPHHTYQNRSQNVDYNNLLQNDARLASIADLHDENVDCIGEIRDLNRQLVNTERFKRNKQKHKGSSVPESLHIEQSEAVLHARTNILNFGNIPRYLAAPVSYATVGYNMGFNVQNPYSK